MNHVILQNDFNMRLRLQQHEKKEVEALETKVNSVNEELKTLLLELIEDNPFPRGVFWFVENKDNLAFEIGKTQIEKTELPIISEEKNTPSVKTKTSRFMNNYHDGYYDEFPDAYGQSL